MIKKLTSVRCVCGDSVNVGVLREGLRNLAVKSLAQILRSDFLVSTDRLGCLEQVICLSVTQFPHM